MSSTSPERPNDRALAGLRIAVGAFFLIFGSYKVLWTGFTLHGGFQKWITGWLADGSAYPFMVPVLRDVVLPHGTAIAFLVAYGETAIGVSLISGVLSRAASAAGFLYMLVLLFSSNYPGAAAAPWQYFGASLSHSVFACCFLAFVCGNPEEVWALPRRKYKGSRTPSLIRPFDRG